MVSSLEISRNAGNLPATVVSLKYFISNITQRAEDNRNRKYRNKKKNSPFYSVVIFCFHDFILFSIQVKKNLQMSGAALYELLRTIDRNIGQTIISRIRDN
jgi:hypothetical protein